MMIQLVVPSVYASGYERASGLNSVLARKYLEHTTVGDPVADAVMDDLAEIDRAAVDRLIEGGMRHDTGILAEAPRSLRDFFEGLETPPAWMDTRLFKDGYYAFHNSPDLFMQAFVVTTLLNASTLTSQALYTTGRITSQFGLRRVRQNIRHLLEIMLPNSLVYHADGWRLSIRIRLVHAQVRKLIRESGNWDESRMGVPLSSAHMGLASANFSAMLLQMAAKLGAPMSEANRKGFMQIWRYASLLCGTPEDLLFEGDEGKTAGFQRIAHLCEPRPGEESKVIANALVRAFSEIAGKTDPADQTAMTTYIYRVSRALIGNELADRLDFPRFRTTGVLPALRASRRMRMLASRFAPKLFSTRRGDYFAFLLDASMIEDLSYRLPDHVDAEKSSPW